MCLVVTMTAPAGERERFEAACAGAAARSGLHVRVEHAPRWRWAREEPVRAFLSEDGTCACSLLRDDADWNAAVRAMRSEVLGPLAEALGYVALHGPEGLCVEALWAGEPACEDVSVTPEELAALARCSAVGTQTRYVVRGAATNDSDPS